MICTGIALIEGIVSGVMGAWTGAGGSKFWRRWAIPLMLTFTAGIALQRVECIGLLTLVIPLSLGYGIPSTEPPDDGSPIGRFWYNLLGKDEHKAMVMTRGTIGWIEGWCLIPLLFTCNTFCSIHWLQWLLISVSIIMANIIFPCYCKDLGQYKLFGKWLLWEESAIYGCLAFLTLFFLCLLK